MSITTAILSSAGAEPVEAPLVNDVKGRPSTGSGLGFSRAAVVASGDPQRSAQLIDHLAYPRRGFGAELIPKIEVKPPD